MSSTFRGNTGASSLGRSRSFSGDAQLDRLSRPSSSKGFNNSNNGNSNGFQDSRFSRAKSSSFDEENPFEASSPLPESFPEIDVRKSASNNNKAGAEARSPPLVFVPPPYTKYDYLLLTIAVAAPILILVFGELNRAQAWVLMNRCYVRDIDNQWDYNVWAVQNQSNATLYAVSGKLQSLANVYPAVLSTTPSESQPFVTLPQFEMYGQIIRSRGQVLFVSYSPFIVNERNRTSWELYSVENQGWVEESFAYVGGGASPPDLPPILDYVWYYNDKGTQDRVPVDGAPYSPSWQSSPPPTDPQIIVNQDFTQNEDLAQLTAYINQAGTPILSTPLNVDSVYGPGVVPGASNVLGTTSVLMVPVYEELTKSPSRNGVINGFVSGVVPWQTFFQNILPDRVVGFQIVVESCGTVNNTFELNGANVTFVGPGDLHDPEYEASAQVSSFADFAVSPGTFDSSCPHTLYMFRTDAWQAQFQNVENETLVLTVTIICTFVLIALGFAVYEYFLRLRFKNRFILANDIYFEENGGAALVQANRAVAGKLSRGDFAGSLTDPSGKVFPETTILFADVVGLEEWSSFRDPSEVFTLLEALYGAFDAIAERSDAYKVETFGDNYVAVCGAPVENRDHPFIMCQFARECLQESKEVFRDLAKQLGRDTKDLAVRFGLNSGPVTASIVPGEAGPRLQLFGDSVSTANFIKNTGTKNMIHLTEQTANLLISSGRRNLVTERKDRKRGSIRTYWLVTLESERGSRTSGRGSRAPVVASIDVDDSTTEAYEVVDTPRQNALVSSLRNSRDTRSSFRERSLSRGRGLDLSLQGSGDKTFQLVQYNSEILVELLKQVVGSRQSSARRRRGSQGSLDSAAINIGNGRIVIEEAVDVISFPEADSRLSSRSASLRKAQLSPEVVDQLYNFVAVVAGLYRPNAFHNIEHATQTTAILSKMLSKVDATRTDDTSAVEESDRGSGALDFAYAIAADPLTKFAMTLAALVHDLDHRGVDNSVLIREEPTLAAAYQGRSVHEQNALELAWNVLLSDGFEELRGAIYTDLNELKLFRQVLVNTVIATDIFDPELRALRKDRFKRAFGGSFRDSVNDTNRKATVAVELLGQASDIGATLQSWSLYTKWNERLYEEAWDAYRSGRTSRNPSLTWYQDEIDFFDKYSIPLAKQLNNCGVFGVAGDEYLNFAEENRRRWVARGREIVAVYVETYGRN